MKRKVQKVTKPGPPVLKVDGEIAGFQLSPDGRPASVFEQDARRPDLPRVVRGEQLCGILEREICLDWKITVNLAIEVCKQVAPFHKDGLAAARLSPSDVIVELRDGRLGAVRLLSDAQVPDKTLFSYRESGTASIGVFCRPSGKHAEPATMQRDVFSIGDLMYACITGAPFAPGPVESVFLESHLQKVLSQFDVPQHIVNILARCLQKDSRKRFRSVFELTSALLDPQWTAPVKRSSKRKWFKAAASVAAVMLVSGVAVAGTLQHFGVKVTFGERRSAAVSASRSVPRIHFDKGISQYQFGDLVTVTVEPRRQFDKLFVFYIDDQDQVISVYPSREQPYEDVVKPLTISRVGENSMFVNGKDGRFVVVSLNDLQASQVKAEEILHANDWSQDLPDDHSLQISGKSLMKRLSRLQSSEPEHLGIIVQQAPKCAEDSVVSDASE